MAIRLVDIDKPVERIAVLLDGAMKQLVLASGSRRFFRHAGVSRRPHEFLTGFSCDHADEWEQSHGRLLYL